MRARSAREGCVVGCKRAFPAAVQQRRATGLDGGVVLQVCHTKGGLFGEASMRMGVGEQGPSAAAQATASGSWPSLVQAPPDAEACLPAWRIGGVHCVSKSRSLAKEPRRACWCNTSWHVTGAGIQRLGPTTHHVCTTKPCSPLASRASRPCMAAPKAACALTHLISLTPSLPCLLTGLGRARATLPWPLAPELHRLLCRGHSHSRA